MSLTIHNTCLQYLNKINSRKKRLKPYVFTPNLIREIYKGIMDMFAYTAGG